jgi:hypothetical protein
MSAHCCHDGTERFEGASPRYRRILWIVIALNALMFGVEAAAGALAGSMALQADAMDFAADAATYGLTLYMLGKPDRWRASAALIKGASLALMGAYVLGATLWRVFVTGTPDPIVMGAVGFAALVVNATAALLLFRFREGDANIRSVWLCSRNDAIGNVAVMLAALGVFGTGTAWPASPWPRSWPAFSSTPRSASCANRSASCAARMAASARRLHDDRINPADHVRGPARRAGAAPAPSPSCEAAHQLCRGDRRDGAVRATRDGAGLGYNDGASRNVCRADRRQPLD